MFVRYPKSHRTQQASVRGICRGGLVGSALQAQSFDQDFTVKVHGRPHILQWAVDANHAAAAAAFAGGPATRTPSILNTCRCHRRAISPVTSNKTQCDLDYIKSPGPCPLATYSIVDPFDPTQISGSTTAASRLHVTSNECLRVSSMPA